jgi:hypothetical protein
MEECGLSFSETFDFWTIFYVGYAVYLGVTSVVGLFWIVFARRLRRAAVDSSTGAAASILRFQYRAVYSILRLGRSSTDVLPAGPSYKQIFTIAGTTGVALATIAGIIVVSLQYAESLA